MAYVEGWEYWVGVAREGHLRSYWMVLDQTTNRDLQPIEKDMLLNFAFIAGGF
jgi:hypothetical protein